MRILGLATRLCGGEFGGPAVWDDPNVDNCFIVEITKIAVEVEQLMATFAAIEDPSNSDRTVTVEAYAFESITSDLAKATDKDDAVILPNDLENAIETVKAILRFVYKNMSTL